MNHHHILALVFLMHIQMYLFHESVSLGLAKTGSVAWKDRDARNCPE